MFPLRSNLVQVAQLEEYMKTLDTNLAPLSEALGTMMECNQVWGKASRSGCKHLLTLAPPSPALGPGPGRTAGRMQTWPVLSLIATSPVWKTDLLVHVTSGCACSRLCLARSPGREAGGVRIQARKTLFYKNTPKFICAWCLNFKRTSRWAFPISSLAYRGCSDSTRRLIAVQL